MMRLSTHLRDNRRAVSLAAAICAATLTLSSGASAQQRFKSAEEAVTALVTAVRSDDPAAIVAVLGRDGRQIAASGDAVADRNARTLFLTAYDLRHRIVSDNKDTAVLTIGQREWPFPIPVVQRNGAWQFDTVAGREEILYRRIGRNELNAIQVALAYGDAQQEYAAMNPEKSPVPTYARRIVSSPGKKDGLFWSAQGDDPRSPIGEGMAVATLQGYRLGGQGPTPYHGYYYKILTEQGPTAPGGAVNYIVKDRMTGGYALVAYPAEYGSSGVMTFLVNHAGVVFQKDLGPRTGRIAGRMTSFGPDHTWKKVPDSELAVVSD
jgi:hypothetical protein